ncbi:MAG: arginine decarboxylase [Aureispira sp.]|nr:arginine decarboxylase [Aureispira sp.]
MNNKFIDLIEQTYSFPQTVFNVEGNNLLFNDIDLKGLVQKFGSPLKLTYLPRIGGQVERARTYFANAMEKCAYSKPYEFAYCTKSSHFAHVIEEVLKHGSHLELSSAFDTEIVLNLYKKGLLKKDTYILCNGYKTSDYFTGIQRMMNAGLTNVVPILDCMSELKVYETFDAEQVNIGIRAATEENPTFELYTSRFGIRQSGILDFYQYRIHKHPKIKLKMLHFFVYTGINDTTYFWNELHKYIKLYVRLRKLCPTLDMLNIGGGLPIQNSLESEYDYQYMCNELVAQLKSYCTEKNVPEPTLFSEFGSFTVGESGACIFEVLDTKRQNDRETWYIVDNSFISTLPDMWSNKQDFVMLPINKWNEEYQRVVLGGLTCDNDDYFMSGTDSGELFLPVINQHDAEPLYIGFFHTGAYQDALSGFRGVHHCLIPSPKHVLIDRDEDDNLVYKLFVDEQDANGILKTLGY